MAVKEMLEPHEFEGNYGGISDRPCTRCMEPDRHPIHIHNQEGRGQMGIASMVALNVKAAQPEWRDELVPLGNRVAIRQDEAPSHSSGLNGVQIEIPDDAKKRPATGTVLGVGPEVGYEKSEATQITVGCRVVFSKYGGAVIRVRNQGDILLIAESDVFAILRDGADAEVD